MVPEEYKNTAGQQGTVIRMDYESQELLDHALSALKEEGINKVALLVFNRNEVGNAFWERQGFTERNDITYRNKVLTEMVRIDT